MLRLRRTVASLHCSGLLNITLLKLFAWERWTGNTKSFGARVFGYVVLHVFAIVAPAFKRPPDPNPPLEPDTGLLDPAPAEDEETHRGCAGALLGKKAYDPLLRGDFQLLLLPCRI